MLKLWYEREMEKRLNIETMAFREWQDVTKTKDYNRTESTPYQAIDKLFEYYSLPDHANFVDIGCGLGRMAFYVHDRFNIPVTGIELNPLTFYDLQKNAERYQEQKRDLKRQEKAHFKKQISAPLNFYCDYAEKFPITKEQNVFYFFNPFTTHIFDLVIRNIENSIFEYPRTVDIVLYYPLYEVQQLIERKTIFERLGSVHLDEIFQDENEKFIVYQYLIM